MADKKKHRLCPECKRVVTTDRDGRICTHGPGPKGEFICLGSGSKELVGGGK